VWPVLLVKTKGMSIRNELNISYLDGVPVCDQSVEMVKEFPYLGSTITSDGEVDAVVMIANVASAFGCVNRPIFTNQGLLNMLLQGRCSSCSIVWISKAYHT